MATPRETSVLIREAACGKPQVEIVGHARQRMVQRDVTAEQILAALRQPDQRGLPTDPGRERVRRHLTVRFSLDVVYEVLPDRVRVISTFKRSRRLGGR